MNTSELSPMSTVDAAQPRRARRSASGPRGDLRAHPLEVRDELDVPLPRSRRGPARGCVTVVPVRAAQARKYDAVEASGSTA